MQAPRRADPAGLKGLFAALLSLKDVKEAEEFLTDLCTPAELCDMADRWRVARLLDRGLPYREINAMTGVSTATVTRVDELVRLRDDARQRITEVTTAAAAARTAYEDAVAAWERAAAKISAEALPAQPPGLADLTIRLAELDTLLAAGRWPRLASELDEIERELSTATGNLRTIERTVVDALGRRDELRGLLGAYQAKAARLGAAEDPGLTERYNHARGLLWTAPCDLAAAADAVTGYQRAVLALGG